MKLPVGDVGAAVAVEVAGCDARRLIAERIADGVLGPEIARIRRRIVPGDLAAGAVVAALSPPKT